MFKYVYYREETIAGPMESQLRLKPSVWGGLETVTEVVQRRDMIGYAFRLAADLTFEHVMISSSTELEIIFDGVYRIKGDIVEFTKSDSQKLSGFLRADGREMVVEEKVYTLLE